MPLNPSDLLLGLITEDDVKEFVHGTNSMRTDNFTLGACDLEMKFQIPGDKLKPFLQWSLGVNYMGYDNLIHRTLPMFHPVHCWAWAKSVSINGQQYNGDDVDAVVWPNQATPAKWKQYEATVTFDIPRFKVLADDEITSTAGVPNEYERFLSKDLSPQVKIVTVDNGQVVYDAGILQWNGQPHNTTIPVGRRDGAGVEMTWWNVPQEFVQDGDDDIPDKLMVAQGKCNDAVFFKRAAETMMLTDVKIDKYVSPVVTDAIGQLYFLYDIHFTWMYVRQLDGDIGLGGSETRRGHNMLLGPLMKYWYAKNASSSKPVVLPINMKKLFTHWSDTIP